MTDLIAINDDEARVFSRLSELASDRMCGLPSRGNFYHPVEPPANDIIRSIGMTFENTLEDDDEFIQVTAVAGPMDREHYLAAIHHIMVMAEDDGVQLPIWEVLDATWLRGKVEGLILLAMISGAVAFLSGEWLASLLPI